MARTARIKIKPTRLICETLFFRVGFSAARMARMERMDSEDFVVTEDDYATVEEIDGELSETREVVQAGVNVIQVTDGEH